MRSRKMVAVAAPRPADGELIYWLHPFNVDAALAAQGRMAPHRIVERLAVIEDVRASDTTRELPAPMAGTRR